MDMHCRLFCLRPDFHAIPPLDGCTFEGIDSGAQPNQVRFTLPLFLLSNLSIVQVIALLRLSPCGLYGRAIRDVSVIVSSATPVERSDATIETLPLESSEWQNQIHMW